jgi:hypothetical protein
LREYLPCRTRNYWTFHPRFPDKKPMMTTSPVVRAAVFGGVKPLLCILDGVFIG